MDRISVTRPQQKLREPYPGTNQFPISRGQLVAFSGNTGGSFGHIYTLKLEIPKLKNLSIHWNLELNPRQ